MDNSGGRLLQPLTYHRDLVDFLKGKEPELWSWMSAAQIASQSAAVRNELLRSTYRVDPEAHPEIMGPALAAVKALGVSVPISVYQSEGESSSNAALIFVPDEAIVLLSGSIVELLNPAELTAIMGHELAHFVLWTSDAGDHLVAERLVNAVANDSFDDAFIETSRLLALSTELFADRGALLACGDLHTAVSALVKVSTGMRSISATSYLQQAEELLAADSPATNRTTHPETVLRSAALEHFATGTDELSPVLEKVIYGRDSVDHLDVLGQQRMEGRTRKLIDELLQLEWFRTEMVLAHMRAYFSDGGLLPRYKDTVTSSPNGEPEGNGENPYSGDDDATKKFFCYVLLDFATVDPDLMPASIVETAVLARRLGFGSEYESTVKSELRLKKKELLNVFAEVAKRPIHRQVQSSGARTSQDALRSGRSGSSEGHPQGLSEGHSVGHSQRSSSEVIDTKGDAR